MSVFTSLPQRVLWKHDRADELTSEAKNVKLIKWAPQQDLLGTDQLTFGDHGSD